MIIVPILYSLLTDGSGDNDVVGDVDDNYGDGYNYNDSDDDSGDDDEDDSDHSENNSGDEGL